MERKLILEYQILTATETSKKGRKPLKALILSSCRGLLIDGLKLYDKADRAERASIGD